MLVTRAHLIRAVSIYFIKQQYNAVLSVLSNNNTVSTVKLPDSLARFSPISLVMNVCFHPCIQINQDHHTQRRANLTQSLCRVTSIHLSYLNKTSI